MDMNLKTMFERKWERYFGKAELPIAFYYTDDPRNVDVMMPAKSRSCFLGHLNRTRKGQSLAFDEESIGCSGGKRYLGFSSELMPNFQYFLSCGIPGQMEGERYKKTPEMVIDLVKNAPRFTAPAKFIVFKRWDMLEESDQPEAVIFFASGDVLAGLFTLANFDRASRECISAPFSAGCGSIVQYPLLENNAPEPRAILGMFDISARPHIEPDRLSFSIPFRRFVEMVNNMDESFLITKSWDLIRNRIES